MSIRKLVLTSVALVVLFTSILYSAPFYNDNFVIEKKSISDITCTHWGDEFLSYIEDPNGYVIVFNSDSSDYAYAIKDGKGNLVPSTVLVGEGSPPAPPHLRISDHAISDLNNKYLQWAADNEYPQPPNDYIDNENLAIILFDFRENDGIGYNGGTFDLTEENEKYYDIELMYKSFFGEGYKTNGGNSAYSLNPSDEENDLNPVFPTFASVRQYFREISHYDPVNDTPNLLRDDYDMVPVQYHNTLPVFNFDNWDSNDTLLTYQVPGFLNPVVYDTSETEWHFLYYNYGSSFPNEDGWRVMATTDVVQHNSYASSAIDTALVQAYDLGFNVQKGYDIDTDQKIHMVYAGTNRNWGSSAKGRYSYASEEAKVYCSLDWNGANVYDQIYYHCHEISHTLFHLSDVGHNRHKWDGTWADDVSGQLSWGVGPYDIMNYHLFVLAGDSTTASLDKFNARSKPPHPSPVNMVLKDIVEPKVINVAYNIEKLAPYTLTGDICLIQDIANPADPDSNYGHAEYFLVCNRKTIPDATTPNFESHWPTDVGLDIYHVDWNGPAGRSYARQANVAHREVNNVLADDDENYPIPGFNYYGSDLSDLFTTSDSLTRTSVPNSDWNDDGLNNGGPSFIGITDITSLTQDTLAFHIISLNTGSHVVPSLDYATMADPNFYMDGTPKEFIFSLSNYGSQSITSNFTVCISEDTEGTDVDPYTNTHTFVAPIDVDETVSYTPLNLIFSSTDDRYVGSEVQFKIDYGSLGQDTDTRVSAPISLKPVLGYPVSTQEGEECRGNILVYDVDIDGTNEYVGLGSYMLGVFEEDGNNVWQNVRDLASEITQHGIAIGNIMPYGKKDVPDILVIYCHENAPRHQYIKIFNYWEGRITEIYSTYETTDMRDEEENLITQPVLSDMNNDGFLDLVYSVSSTGTSGGVRARTFARGTMETIWTYLPEGDRCEALPYQKPIVADFDLDTEKEVAVCLYGTFTDTINECNLGNGYRVIKTDQSSSDGYREIPVDTISVDGYPDANCGYRTTGVAGDVDDDGLLEIICQWGTSGVGTPLHAYSKIGVLKYTGERFVLQDSTVGFDNSFAFNGEMMISDLLPGGNPEIVAGIGFPDQPELTTNNSIEVFSINYDATREVDYFEYYNFGDQWNWPRQENDGPPIAMASGILNNRSYQNIGTITAGLNNDRSQIHLINNNGGSSFGNTENNSRIAFGHNIDKLYDFTIPRGAIAYGKDSGDDNTMFAWTSSLAFLYKGNDRTAEHEWPMKFFDERNSSLHDTVAVPDSLVLPNRTRLWGIKHFGGDVTVSAGDTVYIDPGTIIYMMSDDPDDRFHVYGTLIAEGTAEDSISFIGVDNDTTGGILFHDTCLPNSKLQYTGFYDFKYALEFDGYVETGYSREINNLDFTDCQYALYADSSAVVAENIDFTDCDMSITAFTTHVILDTCKISNSGSYGIYLHGSTSPIVDTWGILRNVEIEEGPNGIIAKWVSQLQVEDARIEGVSHIGMYAEYSSGIISDSFILSSGYSGINYLDSSINLDHVVVNDSDVYGIITYGNSSPVLDNCAIVNNDNVQYYSTSGSLPVIDDRHNDIYREAGNTNYLIQNTGTLQNAIFRCEYNYWGTAAPDYTLFNVNRRIVDYSPWDTAPNVPTISTAETDTFMLACDAELEGDWDLAKERFQWIIQNSPEETQRMEALAHWVNLGSTHIDTWEEKENQLNTWESAAEVGTEFYNGLEDAMARCYVGQKRHTDAIEIYSNRYHNATTFNDSALAEIHINNIYVDMAYSFNGEGSRSTSNADVSIEDREELKPQLGSIRAVHNTNKLKPSSLTKAEKRVRKLMDLIASGKREETSLLPKEFKLASPYPNPFNPTVAIPFEIPKQAEITIAVYNILGQRVSTLVNKPMNAGYHKILWNGKDQYGTPIASGVYFVKMSAPNYIKTRKIVMLK